MNRALALPFSLAVGLAVLTGCGSSTPSSHPNAASTAAGGTSAGSQATPSGQATPNGQTTPSGQAMEGMSMPAAAAGYPAKPTDTQTLICGDEIQGTVKQVLTLSKLPAARSSYAAGLYRCTYALPSGPLRLSVQHSATDAAARKYLATASKALGATTPVPGLGAAAFGTGKGIVLTIKDNETLTVDTTALPPIVGPEQEKRNDLAYEIASDVLGCWTGDDS